MAAQVAKSTKKGKVNKSIMHGRLEKRAGDGSWKAHNFYVHDTVLCYYLEAEDGVEDAPHASLNLLSVECVDSKMSKDAPSVKIVQLWIDKDKKKKVQLRAASTNSGEEPSIDKWENGFMAFVDQAKANGARQKYLDKHKPKSRARRVSDALVEALHGPPVDPQENLNKLARLGIIDFYKEHAPEKVAGVDALIKKYSAAGVDAPTLFTAIKKKYNKEPDV